MASKACFSTWTIPPRGHLSKQFLFCSCPSSSRLKASYKHSIPISASKSNSKTKPPLPSSRFGKESKKFTKDDPWESLFLQLENDLGNDTDDVSDKEITEEDMANFERELDTVVNDLRDVSSADGDKELDSSLQAAEGKTKIENANEDVNVEEDELLENDGEDYKEEYEDMSEDDFEEPRQVILERWQLRKLAAAAKLGRRKVNIKSLAAELQLDRDDVIFFLKNPPPELLMAAAEMDDDSKGDEEVGSVEEGSVEDEDASYDEEKNDLLEDAAFNMSSTADTDAVDDLKKRTYGPRDWIKGKRVKKVNLATLERVYRRTKWPTNAMVESLVRATNLPRRRILEWFEEERAKSGTKAPPRQKAASRQTWKKPVTHSFRP